MDGEPMSLKGLRQAMIRAADNHFHRLGNSYRWVFESGELVWWFEIEKEARRPMYNIWKLDHYAHKDWVREDYSNLSASPAVPLSFFHDWQAADFEVDYHPERDNLHVLLNRLLDTGLPDRWRSTQVREPAGYDNLAIRERDMDRFFGALASHMHRHQTLEDIKRAYEAHGIEATHALEEHWADFEQRMRDYTPEPKPSPAPPLPKGREFDTLIVHKPDDAEEVAPKEVAEVVVNASVAKQKPSAELEELLAELNSEWPHPRHKPKLTGDRCLTFRVPKKSKASFAASLIPQLVGEGLLAAYEKSGDVWAFGDESVDLTMTTRKHHMPCVTRRGIGAWIAATSEGEDFLIVEDPYMDQDYTQTKVEDGKHRVEVREGSFEDHWVTFCDTVDEAAAVMQCWMDTRERSTDHTWERMEFTC